MPQQSPTVQIWDNLVTALELTSSQTFRTLLLSIRRQCASDISLFTITHSLQIQNATNQKKNPHIASD